MLQPEVVTKTVDVVTVGPFRLTNEIAPVPLAVLVTLILITVRFIRYLTRVEDKVDQLWSALVGTGPNDADSFFNRFNVVERRVGEMWDRVMHRGPR